MSEVLYNPPHSCLLQVVLLDLEVLAEISSSVAGKLYPLRTGQQFMLSPVAQKAIKESHHMNDYFTVFILSLMNLFSTDQQLLDDRGSFIIRCAAVLSQGSFVCCINCYFKQPLVIVNI